MTAPKVLDLFSGSGGLSLGFELAGFSITDAVDNWQDALDTLHFNNNMTAVHRLDMGSDADLERLFGAVEKPDVIVGGPPCQGFSIAGKRDPNDPRNLLYKGFVATISKFMPSVFVMENVPTISSPTNKELYDEIIRDFETLGYAVSSRVLLASDYGVPQNRRRMFIVGTKDALAFEFPRPNAEKITAWEAISDLPATTVPDGSPYAEAPKSAYQASMRGTESRIFNHVATSHDQKTVHVISHVPDGGNYRDLPAELQGIRNVNIAWTRLSSGRPSFTVDTGHRHHFHYEYNRVPTVREAARLQSFPDRFRFLGGRTSQMRQVGNAVPPLLAAAVAKSVLAALGGKS
jgi:DNA (cytosine-5)-methyltransferase 1